MKVYAYFSVSTTPEKIKGLYDKHGWDIFSFGKLSLSYGDLEQSIKDLILITQLNIKELEVGETIAAELGEHKVWYIPLSYISPPNHCTYNQTIVIVEFDLSAAEETSPANSHNVMEKESE